MKIPIRVEEFNEKIDSDEGQGLKQEAWQIIWDRLTNAGWHMEQRRLFAPLLGRYWCVEAVHRMSDRRYAAEAPTLKIALKKLDHTIQKDIHRSGRPGDA